MMITLYSDREQRVARKWNKNMLHKRRNADLNGCWSSTNFCLKHYANIPKQLIDLTRAEMVGSNLLFPVCGMRGALSKVVTLELLCLSS